MAKSDVWNPEQYHQFRNERSAPFFDLLERIEPVAELQAIDLGCGTGELTEVLHDKLGLRQTIGLDSSASMLAKATPLSKAGLQFRQGNLAEFCEPNTYDLIFSNAAVQWCDGHEAILGNLYASLKKGGQIAIQMPANHDYPTHTVAEEIGHQEPFYSLLKGEVRKSPVLAAEKYADLLFHLGFSQQEVWLKVFPHVLASREGAIEWVKGTMLTYYESRLEKKDYESFLAAYKQKLFTILPDEKPFFFPFKRVFLWARK